MQPHSTSRHGSESKPATQRARGPLITVDPVAIFGAVAVLLVIVGAQQIEIADQRVEWSKSTALKAQQRTEAQHSRQQQAAQAMCASEHGPQALAVWTTATAVECVNARGRRLSTLPLEASHADR